MDEPPWALWLLGPEVVSLQEAGAGQGRLSCCWNRFGAGQTNTSIKIRPFTLCQEVSTARLMGSAFPSLTSRVLWGSERACSSLGRDLLKLFSASLHQQNAINCIMVTPNKPLFPIHVLHLLLGGLGGSLLWNTLRGLKPFLL